MKTDLTPASTEGPRTNGPAGITPTVVRDSAGTRSANPLSTPDFTIVEEIYPEAEMLTPGGQPYRSYSYWPSEKPNRRFLRTVPNADWEPLRDGPKKLAGNLELIRPSKDGSHFVRVPSGKRFVAWGCNYDHDGDGQLLEDYWETKWDTVVEDFKEMKALNVNVVRIHLQLGRFMKTAKEPNETALKRLGLLLKLAEECDLYLDLTGLGCYHKQDIPKWYDAMGEAARWNVQARFWEAIAKTCSKSNAVFCYDLMNEPILAGKKKETEWLGGDLGGKFFVQRITLDLAGRTREAVAKAWVDKLTAAIRKQDERHMITVGVIPWALSFPGAKPLFYSKEVGANLDFISVHFYPKKGKIDEALKALAVYEVGKPLVIEEMFPLKCGEEELCQFIDRSRAFTDGWISFYWGKTEEEYTEKDGISSAIVKSWLKRFRAKGAEVLGKE